MDAFNLPGDLAPKNRLTEGPILFCNYAAKMSTFKGRCILHQNAISLVLEGEKTIQFANGALEVAPDRLYLLSAGNCLTTIDLAKQDLFRSIMIFFENQVLSEFFDKYNAHPDPSAMRPRKRDQAFLALKKDSFVESYIASLTVLLQSKKEISKEMKRLKLEELLLHLLEKHPESLLSFRTQENQEELDIKRVCEANAIKNVDVNELAFLCNVSASTFKRRFMKIYGVAPQKWFLQKKMEVSARLLRYQNIKPSEVFHRVGYENHSSFSESFKSHFGVSPREFRSNPA